MSGPSPIEWTDASWNPIVGCSIVSPGCTNCYAMKMAARIEAINVAASTDDNGYRVRPAPGSKTLNHYEGTTRKVNGNAVWTGKLALAPDHIVTAPLRWKKPRRIFVNSMGDLFHESIPDEWIDRVFAVMALCPQHTFQVLTKRAERMREYCCRPLTRNEMELAAERIRPSAGKPWSPKYVLPWPLPNVWLGVSAERQQEADERIPALLQTPAAVRFASCEPLLGRINLGDITDRSSSAPAIGEHHFSALPDPDDEPCAAYLDWVIVGGESGTNARPMNPQWARDIRDQCQAAGVAFFHKQNGEFASVSEVEGPGVHHTFDDGRTVRRVGKKAAGRLLDGHTWDEFPDQTKRGGA